MLVEGIVLLQVGGATVAGLGKAAAPYVAAGAGGYLIAEVVVEKIPEHAGKVRAGAWVVGGAAIGTAIAPGVGTVIGAGVGVLVAWWTSWRHPVDA